MGNNRDDNKHRRIGVLYLVVLLIGLSAAVVFIARQFVGLNTSVEYERSVFISQIAEQMKNNVMSSKKNHQENTRNLASVLEEVQPDTFDQVYNLFPQYADSETINCLFFLSSDGEVYGMDGVKQWVSFPDDEYLIRALSEEETTNFIRIGMKQEFMVFSARLANPVEIEGHEIAVLMYGWDSSEYRSTLSSKLFEEKSSALLVRENGSIAIYPEDEDSESYGYNLFSYLEKQGMKEEDLTLIREMLEVTEDRTFLCELEGSRWLFSSTNYNKYFKIFIMLPIQITSANTYQNLYGLISGVVATLATLFLIVGTILWSANRRQREQRERDLQTELLMKTAQAKNDFLAKMSHDIRTPLNGIIGMNYIAATKIPQECTEATDSLRKVDAAAKYLLGILNNILDMSKIENGEIELSNVTFSLEAMREEIESLMISQIEGKDIRIIMDMPENNDFNYIGDELRLKQILINLLSNAVKFTEKGYVMLTVRISPVNEKMDRVTFAVKDTGRGMSEQFLDNAFAPFAQEDGNTADQRGGSGLGLAITKTFVDLMEGSITVSSELGKGSEFVVTLQFERAARVQREDPGGLEGKSPCHFSGKHVMVCEDNDLNAEIAESILGSFDLRVERAKNGKVGVELFEHSVPGYYAMIFMDVRMPQMDGYEATRAIRMLEREDAKQIPICALSANAFSDDIRKSKEAGMNEHLAKPLDVELLADILKKYIGTGEK